MSGLQRVLRLLRVEDLVLALLAAVVLPAVGRRLAGPGGGAAGGGQEPTVLVGLVGLVAIAGVIGCVLTRGPHESPPLADGALTFQGWARFPLAAGVGIVALETTPGLGLDPELFAGTTFVAVVVGALAHPRLPVVPVDVRRVLVLPMAVLAAGVFDAILGDGLGDMVRDLVGGAVQPELAVFTPLILGAIGTLYLMLVVAPRAVADPEASAVAWLVRFAFLVGCIALATVVGLR